MPPDPLSALKGLELKRALRGRKTAVLGLGKSGVSAAAALLRLGARVFISESEPSKSLPLAKKTIIASHPRLRAAVQKISGEFGGHSRRILTAELIVVSPGIRQDLPLLIEARRKGIAVWNELELGWRLTSFPKIAAITGTNGKTTTTALLGDMCRRGGFKPLVAGNIGDPLCDTTDSFNRYRAAVLEVSSYQLEGMNTFRPTVGAVLNLTNDHLARHGTMQGYAKAKERIFMNQTAANACVFNADDEWCRRMAKRCPSEVLWFSLGNRPGQGVFADLRRGRLVARFKGRKPIHLPLPKHLPGLHNVENACAAAACALAMGVSPNAARASLLAFRGVEHRIETVRVEKGVTWVNDSKGTNVDSTLKAVQAFNQPLWLILGGQDKGGSYAPLRELLRDRGGLSRGVLLIGEAAGLIGRALEGVCPLVSCGTLANAVRVAALRAKKGDVVLLSPACASFDQFKNFEDRGRTFKALVQALK